MAFKYSLKVWLTAVVLAPVFVAIYYSTSAADALNALGVYAMFVFVGGLLSIPSFVVLALLASVILNPNYTAIRYYRRLILSVIGFGLTIAPFSVIGVGPLGGDLLFCLPYAAIIAAGIWYYKLDEEDKDEYAVAMQ